jgi:hypothetical protein
MGALTVGFILADYYFNYGARVLTYIFLGSITTILFYVLCLHGFQMINWVFLGIIPIYIVFALLSLYFRKVDISDASDICDSCEMSIDTCECEMPKPKPKPKSCAPKKKPSCKK